MGLVELLVGLVVVGSGSPWILRWGLKGYRQLLVQYRALSAENEAVDMSKPVQVSRQEELMGLVHRQQVAEHTAKAIQSEAALALTEATIEKALSSGDLSLAKQGIQLALPGSPNGAYADSPNVFDARMQQNITHPGFGREQVRAQNAENAAKLLQGTGTGYMVMREVGQAYGNPFQNNASEYFLGLLRGGFGNQSAANIPTAANIPRDARPDDDGVANAVEGELLGPELATASDELSVERTAG